MDDRLTIRISGLPLRRLVTIRALSKAHDGRNWRSEAVSDSGPDGVIDLAARAPVSGPYAAVDGMGMFWSMRPDPKSSQGNSAFFVIADPFTPVGAHVESVCDRQVLGSVRIERRFTAPGVRAEPAPISG